MNAMPDARSTRTLAIESLPTLRPHAATAKPLPPLGDLSISQRLPGSPAIVRCGSLWQIVLMSMWRLAVALLVAVVAAHDARAAEIADQASAIADAAVAEALTLPAGYKRDVILRTVSRNLRWFGQPDAGVRAARAMTDRGIAEVPLSARPTMPRYIPVADALPSGDPCDAGIWREEDGTEAATPAAREAWTERCLLGRDFHWIGPPDVALMRTAASGLPAGDVKAGLLAMLIRSDPNPETLRFVTLEMERHDAKLPREAHDGLAAMLSEPATLYRLGRKDDALAAARDARRFDQKSELIGLLIRDNDPAHAIAIFETIAATPPDFADSCFGWFSPIGGLRLSLLANAAEPSPGLGGFLDLLPASATFRKICPSGLDVELAVENLLAAGRLDEAIARARDDVGKHFLLVDALLQSGRARLRSGDRDRAKAYAIEAAAALPPFDPGDRMDVSRSNVVRLDTNASAEPGRNIGESGGDTARRLGIIQLLAAAGAVDEADSLAHAQPAGALRAVALSAAVAGRAGLRFDEQAPSLSVIAANDL